MVWEIYINTRANHYKFWSIELNDNYIPTGKIIYGKIGSSGVSHYNSPRDIGKRRSEKLTKGYVLLKVDKQDPRAHRWDIEKRSY